MFKKMLLGLLALSGILYAVTTIVCFVSPETVLAQYKLEAAHGTLFLGYVVAWFMLLLFLLSVHAFRLVRKGAREGVELSLMLGLWWAAAGIGMFARYGALDALATDTLRGGLIVLAALKLRKK